MSIEEKLLELSLMDLSKRSGVELASLQTRHFSTERRGIQGDAPKSTKLINSKVDFDNDWITYYFLTEATSKYGPDHQYKDVEPDKNFQFRRNPSQTYEITLRFFNLSQLIRKPEAPPEQAPETEPIEPMQRPEIPSEAPSAEVEVEPEIPVESTPMAPPRPSKPGFGIIPPKEPVQPRPASKGVPRQALSQPLPKVKTAPDVPPQKSQLSLFGDDEPELIPAGNPTPQEQPEEKKIDKQVTQQESLHEAISIQDIKTWMWNTKMQIFSNDPSFHWQGSNYNLSQLDASLYPTDIEPQVWDKIHGDALLSKHLLDLFVHIKFFLNQMAGSLLNKIKHSKESTMPVTQPIREETSPTNAEWKRDAWGWNASFDIEGTPFTAVFEEDSDHLRNSLMAYDTKKDDFLYTFDVPLTWQQRKQAYDKLGSCTEVAFSFGDDSVDNPISLTGKGNVRAVMTNVQDIALHYAEDQYKNLDLFSFEAATDSKSRTPVYLRIAKRIIEKYPELVMVIATNKFHTTHEIFIIKNKVYHALFGQPIKEAIEPAGLKNGLVCSFGAYCPPTRAHIALLQKVVKTAQSAGDSNVVFIQSDPSFQGDEVSSKVKADALSSMVPDLNVCINEGIENFYDAMIWAYNRSYKNVTVIVGNDQQVEFEAILADYNGQTTGQGFFEFDSFKVVSYGKDNPDKSKPALDARQAISAGDFEEFLAISTLPSYRDAKSLFKALVYELQANIGLDESIKPRGLFLALRREDGVRRILNAIRMGGNNDFSVDSLVDKVGNPVSFEDAHKLFNAMYIELQKTRPTPATVFDALEKLWYPQEAGSLGKVGSQRHLL